MLKIVFIFGVFLNVNNITHFYSTKNGGCAVYFTGDKHKVFQDVECFDLYREIKKELDWTP